MGIETEPGQPCHEARLLGCTCTWLRGFAAVEGGDPQDLVWVEVIMWRDPDCEVTHDDKHIARQSPAS